MEDYTELMENDISGTGELMQDEETYADSFPDGEESSDLKSFVPTVSGNESPAGNESQEDNMLLSDILDTLNGTHNYGTIGDYYFQALGCYVFPNFEVYEYFIDIDAAGHEWTETSDGHYIQLQYLEKYEEYITAPEEPEDAEGILPDETELQNLETLESIRGMLSVIKENNTAFYEETLAYQAEMTELVQKTETVSTIMTISGIVSCILLGILTGSFISNVFFGRMRAG